MLHRRGARSTRCSSAPRTGARSPARSVTFEPGARTAWHTHPLGQTLIVTAGAGRVQREGGPVEEIRPGDVVWFRPARSTGTAPADHGDDPHRHPGKAERQDRRLAGAGVATRSTAADQPEGEEQCKIANLEGRPRGLGHRPRLHGHELSPTAADGDTQEMIALIRAAVERGVTFFDTAEVYGPFTNEELVGEALAPIREQVVIATKFGFNIDPAMAGERARQPARAHQAGRRGVAEAAAGSTHRPALSAPRRSERADRGRGRRGEGPDPGGQGQALRSFRGRVRRRSAAPMRCSRSRRCRASIRCGGASPRRDACRRCEELGIGFVPFSPLGKGFLTGTIDAGHDVRQATTSATRSPIRAEANRKANQALVDLLGAIADRQESHTGADRAGLAAAQKPWIVPIPGHDETAPPGGESRRGRCSADPCRPARDRRRDGEDPGGGRPLSRKPGADDRPLSSVRHQSAGNMVRPSSADTLAPVRRSG